MINYFDTRHMTLFDLFDDRLFFIRVGLMHHHLWSKSRCSVRFNLSARVCARFGQENGASELRRDPRQKHPEEVPKRYKVG